MHIKRSIQVQNHSYPVDVPDACPICHRHSEIKPVMADAIDNNAGVQAIFAVHMLAADSSSSVTTDLKFRVRFSRFDLSNLA